MTEEITPEMLELSQLLYAPTDVDITEQYNLLKKEYESKPKTTKGVMPSHHWGGRRGV